MKKNSVDIMQNVCLYRQSALAYDSGYGFSRTQYGDVDDSVRLHLVCCARHAECPDSRRYCAGRLIAAFIMPGGQQDAPF